MTFVRKRKRVAGRLFDYKRPCDRCDGSVFLRSDLQKEPHTGKLVCRFCLDEPSHDDNLAKYTMVQRNFKFE